MKVIWVYVNSNNLKEAKNIGRMLLKERLAACYSLTAKIENIYFWPPRSGKFEANRGPMVILETLKKHYKKVVKRVKQIHSDQVPFIGYIEMNGVQKDFYKWMEGEVK